jgi:predicted Zn finger-like uncharacterized protein
MNNACPTCGAVYAVASKDIGRKIKCKKCSSALRVDDTGLVMDAPVVAAVAAPASAAPVAAAVVADDFDAADDGGALTKKKAKKYAEGGSGGGGVGPILAKVGGVPTILFGIGVFLVIWFTLMPRIGEAAYARAEAYKEQLELEKNVKLKDLVPKEKQTPEGVKNLSEDEKKQIAEKGKSIIDDYNRRMLQAEEDAESSRISNIRDVWFERNGTMFGFLFLSFGCLGYLRSEQPLTLRIVAGVILSVTMILVFLMFSGCVGEKLPIPKGKGGGLIPGLD